MHTIQVKDDKTLGKVLHHLIYEIGGTFRSWEGRKLVITNVQYESLREAGLIHKKNEQKRTNRGAKKK